MYDPGMFENSVRTSFLAEDGDSGWARALFATLSVHSFAWWTGQYHAMNRNLPIPSQRGCEDGSWCFPLYPAASVGCSSLTDDGCSQGFPIDVFHHYLRFPGCVDLAVSYF